MPGQVAFSPIASLPAGEEVTLKVRARAEAVGNHIFRAEVRCAPLGTRLVSEETTHFYQDAPPAQTADRVPPPSAGRKRLARNRPIGVMPRRPRRLPGVPPQNGPAPGTCRQWRRQAYPSATTICGITSYVRLPNVANPRFLRGGLLLQSAPPH